MGTMTKEELYRRSEEDVVIAALLNMVTEHDEGNIDGVVKNINRAEDERVAKRDAELVKDIILQVGWEAAERRWAEGHTFDAERHAANLKKNRLALARLRHGKVEHFDMNWEGHKPGDLVLTCQEEGPISKVGVGPDGFMELIPIATLFPPKPEAPDEGADPIPKPAKEPWAARNPIVDYVPGTDYAVGRRVRMVDGVVCEVVTSDGCCCSMDGVECYKSGATCGAGGGNFCQEYKRSDKTNRVYKPIKEIPTP